MNRTRAFDGASSPLFDIWGLRAGDGHDPSRGEPGLHLGEIPHDAPGRQGEAPRKVTALLHLVDSAVGEGNHLAELMASNRSLERGALRFQFSSPSIRVCR